MHSPTLSPGVQEVTQSHDEDHDPEAAPVPDTPDDGHWGQLTHILCGPTR